MKVAFVLDQMHLAYWKHKVLTKATRKLFFFLPIYEINTPLGFTQIHLSYDTSI